MARKPSHYRESGVSSPSLTMEVSGFAEAVAPDADYALINISTDRGDVACRYYPAPNATRGAIWVSGAIGGFHSPALGLYPNLAREFVADGIASLQICWRDPHDLAESTLDILAGATFLHHQGISILALIGHSFGGAVVIQAAAADVTVRTVVPLSTQSYGADPAVKLGPHCSMLLIHGSSDEILSPACSEYVYSIAHEPRRLLLLPETRHGLDEAAPRIHEELRRWIPRELTRAESLP